MEQLPIHAVIPAFVQAIREQKNVVLTAPTGSGKSTQIPQAIADSGLVRGTIIVVQPRRVACRALARRVAQERKTAIGNEIGYIVRYDAQQTSKTKILFVTDGVLIRFLEKDPDLSWVGAVIFDEFHERRASGDIALGMLKQAKTRRPSLALIVMSATIEGSNVARYLQAVVITGEGRQHPVDIRHMPTVDIEEMSQVVAQRIADRHRSSRQGDILAFLPGKEEIDRTIQHLAGMNLSGLDVLPLHGELKGSEQDRVFAPCAHRKAIISTNIAETSVTIPGVMYVIDTGFERRVEFDATYGLNRLTLQRISNASAQQRSGRAGRERPGECIRLWSKKDHDCLAPSPPAEIQVTDLSGIILTLKSIGIEDATTFDFLDVPDIERLRAGEVFLKQLGALDEKGVITPIGWRMVRLPLSPRYARMVVEAERGGCLHDIATIAALMTGKPIYSPAATKNKRAATEVKLNFAIDDSSDFFALLELFRQARLHRWSQEWHDQHFISRNALQEARRLRFNIIRIAYRRGSYRRVYGDERRAAIRRCLLAGLVDRIAIRTGPKTYTFGNDLSLRVDVSSLTDSQFLAFGEVRSGGRKARGSKKEVCVSLAVRVDEQVLIQIAPHLVTRRRIPLAFDRETTLLSLREDVLLQEMQLHQTERTTDLVETIDILKEQALRALQHGWRQVHVLPGIRRRGIVMWEGKRIGVEAERTGLHWATVIDGANPVIVLQEPIVSIPEMEKRGIPTGLQHRVERLSSTIARLVAAP